MSLTLDKWVHMVLEDMRKEFPVLTLPQCRALLLVHLREHDPRIFMTLMQTRSMFKIKDDFEPIPGRFEQYATAFGRSIDDAILRTSRDAP